MTVPNADRLREIADGDGMCKGNWMADLRRIAEELDAVKVRLKSMRSLYEIADDCQEDSIHDVPSEMRILASLLYDLVAVGPCEGKQ